MAPFRELLAGVEVYVRSLGEWTAPPRFWSRGLTSSTATVISSLFVLDLLWVTGEHRGGVRIVERLFVGLKRTWVDVTFGVLFVHVRSYRYACYAVSPSGWFGPEGQLYSEVVAALGVDNDSGMFIAGYAGIYESSLCSLRMPAMPGIMLGFVAVAVLVVHRQLHARAGFAGCDASAVAGVVGIALCFLRCRQAHDARYDQKDSLQRHSGRTSVDKVIGMCMAGVAGF